MRKKGEEFKKKLREKRKHQDWCIPAGEGWSNQAEFYSSALELEIE